MKSKIKCKLGVVLAVIHIASSSYGMVNEDFDQYIQNSKPTDADHRMSAIQKCERLSESAARRGVNTLVIAFEGWLSFSREATQNLYRYHWDLNQNAHSTFTDTVLGAGYVARGTLPPLVSRLWNRIEVLSYSFDEMNSSELIPLACAKVWLTHRVQGTGFARRNLILIGHSLGGSAVLKLSKHLEGENLPVALAVTLDPVCSVVGLCDVEF